MRATVLVVAAAAVVVSAVSVSLYAGDLNPPVGPVSGTMKTLDEIEARIAVGPDTTPGDGSATYVISQSGSYYLTSEIVSAGKPAIRIDASFVTLDLNGFAVSGDGATDTPGIVATLSPVGVVIRNGVVRHWRGSGLELSADFCVVENLRVMDFARWAIDATDSYLFRVQRSTVASCGGLNAPGGGIRGDDGVVVSDTDVIDCKGAGIAASGGVVRNCTVRLVGVDASAGQLGDGVVSALVENTMARDCAGTGIVATTMARGCASIGSGVSAYDSPQVVESY